MADPYNYNQPFFFFILHYLASDIFFFKVKSGRMFYHDMYILCPRLSGESPFQGNSDAETLALVTAASYEFYEDSFEDISEQAKDFIRSLLQKDRRCAKKHTRTQKNSFVVRARVIRTDDLRLVPYSLELIMSHLEQKDS